MEIKFIKTGYHIFIRGYKMTEGVGFEMPQDAVYYAFKQGWLDISYKVCKEIQEKIS